MLRTGDLQISLYAGDTLEIRDGQTIYVHLTPPETADFLRWIDARDKSPNTSWAAVCDDNMPPMYEIAWLWDGRRIWIGGRSEGCDGWLWGNTYGSIWHNGVKWDGDIETDDDYRPTHWMRLPDPPNTERSQPGQHHQEKS